MTSAKDWLAPCTCNRDWIFRHMKYTRDGHAIGGKTVCYTCGHRVLFDIVFSNATYIEWKHESLGAGTWPIPDDAWAELEKIHAQRNERTNG